MDHDVIPVVRELSADTLTPLVAFAALTEAGDEAFLFESVERGENLGRYSFIGFEPRRNLTFDARVADPVRVLNDELQPLHVEGEAKLPPFFGGAVGYFGYGAGGWSERIPDTHANDLGIPDAKLLFFDNVVVFDHVQQRLYVVANLFRGGTLDDANRRLDRAIARLHDARVALLALPREAPSAEFRANMTRDEFESMVRAAKEEIVAGEIFQIVVSQRWETEFPTAEALTLYRALRSINPSPYMFLLRTNECTLVGASPEMLVRVTGKRVDTRPIAGTRPRGKTHEEDVAHEQSLIADPKENAEHLMLVDLGRNDLGRVSRGGSVEVTDFRHVERYSHVMHLVTDVHGTLRDDCTPVDAFLSCFPAGTVSGAPKIRAMELIDRFEPTRRGPYAGAVAYFGFSGNLDSCITIRTVVLANDRAYVQAGAGIVFDSDPAAEYEEGVNKSAALRRAISVAKAVLGR
ncbi:MAG: anthranilate synthase component I [Acidobacteria bacterium]|nr:anthranilate synthase component I [Acidobacteriota bacterium]MBV9476571.1 anthranilate synthase component I [Acidobacteriota bacterium]